MNRVSAPVCAFVVSLVCSVLCMTGCMGMIGAPPKPKFQQPTAPGRQAPPTRTTPGPNKPLTDAGQPDAPGSPDAPEYPDSPGTTDAGNQTPDAQTPDEPKPTPACQLPASPALVRITTEQYKYTVQDVFGVEIGEREVPGSVLEEYGFRVTKGFSVRQARLYMELAEYIATNTDLTKLSTLPCSVPPKQGENLWSCAGEFIGNLSRKLQKRKLTQAEEQKIYKLFETTHSNEGFESGIRIIIEYFLQSPLFLYRVEKGDPNASGQNIRLSNYEMAYRLASFLWRSVPDGTLFAKAEEMTKKGLLLTPEFLKQEARRMLNDPRAKRVIRVFFTQYLQLDDLGALNKDKAVYPSFSNDLAKDMREETLRFIDYVMWDAGQKGSFRTLLTARFSFLNEKLAKHYGISGVTGSHFRKVQINQPQRTGFLTHGSLMTLFANSNQSSPIHRGLFIRKRMLCGEFKLPPGFNPKAPDLDPNLSTRDRFAAHRNNKWCKSCHEQIDPIGFGFENFDGIGQFRVMEGKFPIDASGQIVASDIAGSFNGPADLATKLAGSRDVQTCFVRHWFRFAFARKATNNDACLINSVQQQFASSNLDVRELILALVTHKLFQHHKAVFTYQP